MGLQLSHQVSLQGSKFLGRATRNRFDVHCSGFPSLLQVAFDRGPGHAKQLDDISALISLIDGSKHPFSQILRIGFHWLPPFGACLLLAYSFHSITRLKIFANRCREERQKILQTLAYKMSDREMLSIESADAEDLIKAYFENLP